MQVSVVVTGEREILSDARSSKNMILLSTTEECVSSQRNHCLVDVTTDSLGTNYNFSLQLQVQSIFLFHSLHSHLLRLDHE